jgi:hypothetical protein
MDIPKHMGGQRSGDANKESMDHSLSKHTQDRTEKPY